MKNDNIVNDWMTATATLGAIAILITIVAEATRPIPTTAPATVQVGEVVK